MSCLTVIIISVVIVNSGYRLAVIVNGAGYNVEIDRNNRVR